MSKLNWDEQNDGKHAEMLAWMKELIALRRSTIALNDGDRNHLMVSTDEENGTLVMEREEARVVLNIGKRPYTFALLEDESVRLVSREGVEASEGSVTLPPVTLAVLLSSSEAVEDRTVSRRVTALH